MHFYNYEWQWRKNLDSLIALQLLMWFCKLLLWCLVHSAEFPITRLLFLLFIQFFCPHVREHSYT